MLKEIIKYGILIMVLIGIFGLMPILKLIIWIGIAYLGFSLIERIFRDW